VLEHLSKPYNVNYFNVASYNPLQISELVRMWFEGLRLKVEIANIGALL